MKKTTFILWMLVILSAPLTLLAQKRNKKTWDQMAEDPNANFYDIQKTFYKENAEKLKEIERERSKKMNLSFSDLNKQRGKSQEEEEFQGFELFKRWENFMEPRVFPSGNLSEASRAYTEYLKWQNERGSQRTAPAHNQTAAINTWTPLGPTGTSSGGGAGRLNFLRFDPVNPNILYTGSPAGGLWKSADAGNTWTTNTDNLAVIGCSDVAINPANTQIMYLATGDRDATDTYSIGLLKSTDGGSTWNTTGLSFAVSQAYRLSRVLINPTNPSIIIVSSNNGIFRSTDAGVSFTQSLSGTRLKSMEYRPTDPNTVYACGTNFYKSTDGGATWTQITSGLPSSTSISRMTVAVSVADPTYVYVLASSTSSTYNGVYRSTDNGTTFAQRSGTPNILGYSSTGSDASGQGWYTLSLAVSPVNRDEVIVGGVNIWRSLDGGGSWTLNAHWTGTGAPYVHADIHQLIYLNGTTFFSANDGGLFKTTDGGTTWLDKSGNMQIAELYSVASSATSSTYILGGEQDNGTNLMNGAAWSEVLGGDGMVAFIDRTTNNTLYAEYYNGAFQRSTNGGANWTGITGGLSGAAAWVTPWMQDPVISTTIYAGYTDVFKSTNQGSSWTQLGTLGGSGTLASINVAPSNTQYIYAARSGSAFRSTDGGTSWTNITGTLPVGSTRLTDIEINPTNPLQLWITCSGYSSGNKIFASTDGGTTWTNYSAGLPNLPANCVVYQSASPDGLYLGCDVGVYYRDNTMPSWQPYMNGLPNVVVKDIDICNVNGKLRAGTYGRSVWECSLFSPGTLPPVAAFTSNKNNICPGQAVNFTDLSGYSPTTWSWTFQGGTPASSTVQNPAGIVYSSPGTFSVTLVASNVNGSNTRTQSSYINVSGSQVLPLVEGFQATGFPPPNWFLIDAGNDGKIWARNTAVGGFGASTACMMYDDYSLDCTGFWDEIRTPKYDFTSVTSSSMTFDIAYARGNTTYTDTLEILGSSDCGLTWTSLYLKGGTALSTNGGIDILQPQFVPTSTQWRTETINLNAYSAQPSVMISFKNRGHYGQTIYIDNVNIANLLTSVKNPSKDESLFVYPNPNNGFFNLTIAENDPQEYVLHIYNTIGQLVYDEKINHSGGQTNKTIDLSSFGSGVYTLSLSNTKHAVVKKVVVY